MFILDAGLPLDAPLDGAPHVPPAGLDAHDPAALELIVSHDHPDHYGLVDRVDPSVPVYIGTATGRP